MITKIIKMIEMIATKYSRRHGFQPRCLLQQEYVRPLTTKKYVALIIVVTTLIIMTTLIIVATLIIVVRTLIIMTTLIIVTTIMMMVMMMWQ